MPEELGPAPDGIGVP